MTSGQFVSVPLPSAEQRRYNRFFALVVSIAAIFVATMIAVTYVVDPYAEARDSDGIYFASSPATISRYRAVATIGRARLAGMPAWVLWLVVHLSALVGLKNRLSVFFNWTIGLLGGGRAERVMTLQQVFARRAMEERPLLSGLPKSDEVPTLR